MGSVRSIVFVLEYYTCSTFSNLPVAGYLNKPPVTF